jgi:hypothetical protein
MVIFLYCVNHSINYPDGKNIIQFHTWYTFHEFVYD